MVPAPYTPKGYRGQARALDYPAAPSTYRSSPLLADGSPAFTAHVDASLRPAGTGTDLEVRYGITGSAVDSADFVAGIEIGFGQSLDKLAAILTAHPAPAAEADAGTHAHDRTDTPGSTQ